jgi:alkylation response protein AidB-like acyl-CoA dehydrogenase
MLMIQRLGALPLVLARGPEDGWIETIYHLAAGEWTPAFALTERDAGSDPSGMKATATRDGEGWLIDGQKTWISNALEADILLVFAVTDPCAGSKGISAFVVDSHLPGIDIEPTAEKVGLRGMSTGTITLASVRVDGSALLGSEGQGLRIALKALDISRLGVAAQATGLAQGALDAAAVFANSRSQFGKPLIALPGLAFPLAEHYARSQRGGRSSSLRLITPRQRVTMPACSRRWLSSCAPRPRCQRPKLLYTRMAQPATRRVVMSTGLRETRVSRQFMREPVRSNVCS